MFLDIRFPDDIAYGATGGPKFSTDVVITGSGYEQRNINWSEAQGEWTVGHGVKTPQQMKNLLAFFRVTKGKGHTFRFKDWADYKVDGSAIGTGDGSNRSFQITKTYKFGDYTHIRDIRKPVQGTLHVFIGGAENVGNWTCDYATGIITFGSAPATGAVITVTCEFDCVCRFDTDKMDINLKEFNVQAWESISVVEVKT